MRFRREIAARSSTISTRVLHAVLATVLLLPTIVNAQTRFVSPGAEATKAIIEAQKRQEEQRRQAEEDERARRLHEAQMERLRAEQKLLEQQTAPPPPPTPSDTISLRFQCEWGQGTSANWDEGRLSLKQANFGRDATVVFDSLNPQAGIARITGSGASSEVRFTSMSVGVTFIETTPSGMNITTIYKKQADQTRLAAVTSRHLSLGSPFPSQFYGSCVALQ